MQATHHRRRITFGTLALTLAFLLGSMVPSNASAEANSEGRPGAVSQANDYVDACVAAGGEPNIEDNSEFGFIAAYCYYEDTGYTDYCYYNFDDTRSCGGFILPQPNPGVRPPAVTGGDSAAQPSANGSSTSGEEGSDAGTAPPTADEGQQSMSPNSGNDDERETNTGKKSKKGKKGKKGGKHRKR